MNSVKAPASSINAEGLHHHSHNERGCFNMIVLKVIAKVLLFPAVILLALIQWAGIFINKILGIVLGILSVIIILTAIGSIAFRLASGPYFLQMTVLAFIFFLVPHIGNWIITRIEDLRYILGDFIRS